MPLVSLPCPLETGRRWHAPRCHAVQNSEFKRYAQQPATRPPTLGTLSIACLQEAQLGDVQSLLLNINARANQIIKSKAPQAGGQTLQQLNDIAVTSSNLAARLAQLRPAVTNQRLAESKKLNAENGGKPYPLGGYIQMNGVSAKTAQADNTATAHFLSHSATAQFLQLNKDVIPASLEEDDPWPRYTACKEVSDPASSVSNEVRLLDCPASCPCPYLLPAACCLLPAACCLLPAALHVPPTSGCSDGEDSL